MSELIEAVFIKFLIKWGLIMLKMFALGAAVLFLAWSLYGFFQRSEKIEEEVSSSLLINEVRSIRELSTLRQDYTDTIEYKSEDWVKMPLFGTRLVSSEKSFRLSYSATVKIGYDLDNVKIEKNGKSIIVRYPHSKILSHEISDVKVIEWDNGLWNKLDQKIFMEKVAEQSDIYVKTHLRDFDGKASAQFERIVSRHLSALLRTNRRNGGDYRIEFVQENPSMISKVFN